jgi:heterodisulfide reductase subunit A
VEKEMQTGGHLNDWYRLFPDRRESSEVKSYFNELLSRGEVVISYGLAAERITKSDISFTVSLSDGKDIYADAVIVATGFDLFKCSKKEEYGYGIYDNVITSGELEKMFKQNAIRLSDGRIPKSFGMVHCVGSRDEKVGNLYCSKLCCVTAVKQAMEIRENIPDSKVFCFYMDMRMGGAHYEELYREAQEKWNIIFIRGKISEISESINGKLIIKSEDTLAGRPLKMELDMIVLMAAMEMPESATGLAVASDLERGENRFFATTDHHYGSNRSKLPGLFYAGTCTMPMNITESIAHARSAVADVIEYLKNGA